MSGVNAYRIGGPSGWVGDYAVITPSSTYVAPDNCIGFFAKSAGNVSFTTTRSNTAFTFPIAAGAYLPGEIDKVTAWTGTAGDLYATLR